MADIDVHALASGYEFRGDNGDYTPTESERAMLEDFGESLLAELARRSPPPAVEGGWRDIESAWKAGRDAAAKIARERSFDLRCANSGAEVMPDFCSEGDTIADTIETLEMPK